MVVDKDLTNYKDLLDDTCNKYPWGADEFATVKYFDSDKKTYYDVLCDADLMNMSQQPVHWMAIYNWLFIVAYGILESENTESWKWFMENLQAVIGNKPGLVIHTDAGKGLETAIGNVFRFAEHRECMRHLVENFNKKFKGKVFDDNLWPAAYSYSKKRYDQHISKIATNAKAIKWLHDNHPHLWSRSLFSELSKVDYVTNNLAESFNNMIKDIKGLPVVDLIYRMRQKIMVKMDLRRRIGMKFEGHLILPSVIKDLNAKAKRFEL